MIHLSSIPYIGGSSQKMAQLGAHHRRQIFTHDFLDVQTYHLKKLLRSLLNALLRARDMSGSVAHNLSGIIFHLEVPDEKDREATGDSDNAI